MLKQLKKCLESEKKDKDIFDIIIFGSLVKGKSSARDIDIAVIFLKGNLRERLDKIQNIKNQLKTLTKLEIDIKQITLKDLFSADFPARTGILLEGESVFSNKKFCETLGFKAFTLFWYALKGLSHSQKVRFNYILAGRTDSQGIIQRFNGKRLVSGAIKIPIQKSIEFEEILKQNSIPYNKKNILEQS